MMKIIIEMISDDFSFLTSTLTDHQKRFMQKRQTLRALTSSHESTTICLIATDLRVIGHSISRTCLSRRTLGVEVSYTIEVTIFMIKDMSEDFVEILNIIKKHEYFDTNKN